MTGVHEMGMCEGVVEAVERRAGARPVARVGVRLGALLQVVPEAFQQSFEIAAAGGVAAGARTELTIVPVQGRCRDCGDEVTSFEPVPACPACGSVAYEGRGGDEIVLEWIEYAEEAGGAGGG